MRESTFTFQVEYVHSILHYIDKKSSSKFECKTASENLFASNPVSGHGKDNVTVLTEENKNPPGEDDLPLVTQNSAGECVLGTGVSTIATSIHSIKVELNKMNAQKITMTLDCCRNVSRDAEAFVVYLK